MRHRIIFPLGVFLLLGLIGSLRPTAATPQIGENPEARLGNAANNDEQPGYWTGRYLGKGFALQSYRETPRLAALLAKQLKLDPKNERLELRYVAIKQEWAYLVGEILVLVEGQWEAINTSGAAALFRKVNARWIVVESVGYIGPSEPEIDLYVKKIRRWQRLRHLPEGLLPNGDGALVWGEDKL